MGSLQLAIVMMNSLFRAFIKINIADKSQNKYLKFILRVNKYSSNIAVMSETGRFLMYFSIITSIIKYLYRLQHCDNALLRKAYKLTYIPHNCNVQILKSMGIDFE